MIRRHRYGASPSIYCDLCGFGVMPGADPDEPAHFCGRHKARDVLAWYRGEALGYVDIAYLSAEEREKLRGRRLVPGLRLDP